ncbi:DUF859 family phage minor structural protein [Neobacillus rhizosphaerae]|uniref:DUF859 family phage minor structural protein n=1 Tax=Neobacillus rhizosphaerae TaxID=2880965 RepID=UPI003D2C5A1A
MALSGSFSKTVDSHWRIRCTWSGSQSVSGNYTDVTLKVYWESTDSYGTTYTSTTKSGSSTIFNYNSSGSDDTESFSFSAKLSGQDSTLVHTQTTRVYHNSDGTKSFSMSASLAIELTLGGTYYGTVTASSGTVTLNTIPRASTLTSSASWTAGNNLSISISRADADFTHTVKIYVPSSDTTPLKTITGIGTSTTVSFSTTDNTEIFNVLNTGSSTTSKIELITYSGGTPIGTNTYTGTITAPSASSVSSVNGFGSSANEVYIDQSLTVNISRANSGFTHTIELWVRNPADTGAIKVKSLTGVGTSTSYTLTQDEMNLIYNATPNSNNIDGNIRVYTYYNGELVRTYTDYDVNWNVRNSNPTFSASSISYADVNSKTTGVTNDSSYIVQNQSDLRVYVNTSASMKNGATFSKYVVTVNGKTGEITTATGNVTIGKITASTNVTLTVTVYDSRGNSTAVTTTVKVLSYAEPVVSVSLSRANKFENSTTMKVSGSFSPITIGTTIKNTIDSLVYRYRVKGTTTWSADTAIVFTISGSTYTANNVILDLDNTKAWEFEIVASDKLLPHTEPAQVGTGQPIAFIDSVKKSVSVNMFPQNSNSFEVTGDLWLYATEKGTTKVGGVFTANTDKTYLKFKPASGSNDPAWIMHETSSDSANQNRGVLHLCPTDDNDNVNDYVAIHGTNDPETIKFWTGGDGWFAGSVKVDGGINVGSYLNIDYTGDASPTSTNAGLRIGSENGDNIKIDGNEIIANQNGSAGVLYLQNEGGQVKIGNNTGGVKLIIPKGEFIIPNATGGTETINLRLVTDANSAYIQAGKDLNDTSAELRIARTGTASTNIEVLRIYSNSTNLNGALHVQDIYIDNDRTIIWTPPGNYDQTWYDETNNTYHFTADTASSKTSGNATIKAGSFTTTSDRKLKTNIQKYSQKFGGDALLKVKNTPVYTYSYLTDLTTVENGRKAPEFRVGLMADEVPDELLSVNKDGIDLYSMLSTLWKAVQEVATELKYVRLYK